MTNDEPESIEDTKAEVIARLKAELGQHRLHTEQHLYVAAGLAIASLVGLSAALMSSGTTALLSGIVAAGAGGTAGIKLTQAGNASAAAEQSANALSIANGISDAQLTELGEQLTATEADLEAVASWAEHIRPTVVGPMARLR